MSVSVSNVFLRMGTTGELIPALLYDSILSIHFDQHEREWKPAAVAQEEEHGHWNWRRKWETFSHQLSHQAFALECEGMLQGLMIVNTIKRCRLPEQVNKHLVYIEYLEAAPWNRTVDKSELRYQGVGKVLVAAAIQLSFDDGSHGRIGLHSLPQADTYYSRCGMTDLGPDQSYPDYPLRYFEMTESQAASFLGRGS